MGLFSGLIKLTLNTVTLPITVVKTIVDKDAIEDKIEEMKDNTDEIYDEL